MSTFKVGDRVQTAFGSGRISIVVEGGATSAYPYAVRLDGYADGPLYYRADELTAVASAPAPAGTVKYPATLVPGMPHDAIARKQTPVHSGVIKNFPHALAEVAKVSYIGNDQHNPGQPVTWDREKSTDEDDAGARHMLDTAIALRAAPGQIPRDALGNSLQAQEIWRKLARLEKDIEAALAAEKETK